MHMLADLVELVIGVDTHKHTHTAAVVATTTGATIEQLTVPATPAGYQQLLQLADRHDGRRVWAVEGTGGYGAGLTRFLHAHAEQVVELDRPKRATRRHGAKSDPWTPPGRPARPWAATASPSPAPPGTGQRCRCGLSRPTREAAATALPSGGRNSSRRGRRGSWLPGSSAGSLPSPVPDLPHCE